MMNNKLIEPSAKIQELKHLYCNAYKDVYGIKPLWIYKMNLTEADIEQMTDQLEKDDIELAEARNKISERMASFTHRLTQIKEISDLSLELKNLIGR